MLRGAGGPPVAALPSKPSWQTGRNTRKGAGKGRRAYEVEHEEEDNQEGGHDPNYEHDHGDQDQDRSVVQERPLRRRPLPRHLWGSREIVPLYGFLVGIPMRV